MPGASPTGASPPGPAAPTSASAGRSGTPLLATRGLTKSFRGLTALKGQELNEAKKILATEATVLLHGRAAADNAAETAQTTFEQGGMGESLATLTVREGDGILAVLTKIGFTSSNSQARQFVKDGAVYLGDRRITEPSSRLQREDFNQDGRNLLRLGKKRGILTFGPE